MRLRRPLTAIVLAVAVSAIGVGISLAKTPTTTLKSSKISALQLTVLADAKGRTLYRLKPETPKHLLCTSKTCLSFWKPATVKSKTTKVKLPKGITGKVTLLHRGKAYQICVGGLPLYTFVVDTAKGKAAGQHIHSFGGVWGVLKLKSAAKKPVVAPPPPPAY